MPKSRGRKKKKPKQKARNREIVNLPGMQIIRKGKNLFWKNTMTEDEHAAYLKQLQENRPKLYDEIKEMIQQTAEKINSYDKILVLGGIASYGYMKMLTDESDDGLSETTIEYCQSIATATPNINKGKVPTPDILNEIYEALVTIRRHFSAYYAVEHVTGKHSKIESDLRHHMISETLFIRGEGYLTHLRQLFIEMFAPHDTLFEKHYGFKSKDLLDTFDKLEESYGCRLLMPNGRPHPVQTIKLHKWMEKNNGKVTREMIETGEYLNEFSKEHPEVIVHNNGVILYPLNQINTYEGLYKIRHFNDVQKKVATALALKFGDNKVFSEPEKFKYEILNKSEIYTNPIVEGDDNHLYLFSMNLAARNYFLIAQSLIQKADPHYYQHSFLGNRIQIAKDEFIEQKTFSLFKKMLPKANFYKGVHYTFKDPNINLKCTNAEDGRYELDILGISKEATYLIEVKSGLVSDGAKRGALSSIKTDLSGIIGDAICQSYRASLYINENPSPSFETSDGKIVTPINKDKVFRISISFSYVGSLISSLSKLQEFGVIEKNSSFAWTVNIFDLIPFTELMTSEEMFIDYLSKRLQLYNDKRLVNIDEMDMLGLYFDNDLKIDKAFKNADTVQLNQYKKDIDNYFDRGGRRPSKK
jgi:hypothetical protein